MNYYYFDFFWFSAWSKFYTFLSLLFAFVRSKFFNVAQIWGIKEIDIVGMVFCSSICAFLQNWRFVQKSCNFPNKCISVKANLLILVDYEVKLKLSHQCDLKSEHEKIKNQYGSWTILINTYLRTLNNPEISIKDLNSRSTDTVSYRWVVIYVIDLVYVFTCLSAIINYLWEELLATICSS